MNIKNTSETFEKTNFDFTLLDRAAELSARMGNLLGAYTKEKTDQRRIRDQAYVCLKNMMAEIRKYGKYVFHQDRIHAGGYASAYNRMVYNRRKKRTARNSRGRICRPRRDKNV